MKKSMFVLLVASTLALGFGVMTQAQAPKEHSMTGCLEKGTAPDTYTLTHLEKGPASVGIVSSDVNLAPHVGHKIEVTGVAVPEAEAQSENKDVPKAPHYMKLSSIKMISRTCP